jgi:hypothetical protein
MSYTADALHPTRALVVDASVLAAAVDAIRDCAQAYAADTDAT